MFRVSNLLHKKYTNLYGLRRYLSSENTLVQTLPFMIDKNEAYDRFVTDIKFMEDIYHRDKSKNLVEECFIPFHSASIHNVTTNYTVVYGKYQSNTTIWNEISGTTEPISYPFGHRWSQIYAGFSHPRNIIEEGLVDIYLDPFVPLTHQMVHSDTKRTVYPHEMNISFAHELMNDKLSDVEYKRLIYHITKKYDAHTVRIIKSDTNYSDISFCSYYIPAYIYKNSMDDYVKYKIVNGYTGIISSNYILSKVKSMWVGAWIGGLLSFIISPPIYSQSFIAMIMCSCASMLVSGNIANYYNKLIYRKIQRPTYKESLYNNLYVETCDDINRRDFATRINQTIYHQYTTHHHNTCLSMDGLELFQLDTIKTPTKTQLKNAYHTQIKRWHPDVHPDKETAIKMTIKLNLAYDELMKKM